MNGNADQIQQVDRDLAAVAAQLDDGELDAATADRLRASYEQERAALLVASAAPRVEEGRSPRRVLIGAAILAVGAIAIVASGLVSLRSDTPEGSVTDGVATDVLENGGDGNDLASVTNEEMEAVVAANPTVVGMRLALAGRYVEDGDHSSALDHYLTVLDQDPDQAEALAMVGWLTFLAGEPELAEPFVAKSLVVEPDYPLALWFFGNILMVTGDHDGATQAIERLLAYDLTSDVRAEADALLVEIAQAESEQ